MIPYLRGEQHRYASYYSIDSFLSSCREQGAAVRMPMRYRGAASQSCPVNRQKAATASLLGLSGISKRQLFLPDLVSILDKSSFWYDDHMICLIN
ncbi:hypothetical protein NPIL_360721 [Nephila pilipes]|uniref:Uncharacterized protein n=1 Tax=Nephila pilipes TaxID=299642 RepID=A0A8X6NUI6_NEPPI|nr:hypothetical protein NPIL_360721 [Nephila pilipes]